MRALLDTHVWLWMSGDSSRLGSQTRALLENLDNELWLSAASAWEIAIKAGRHGFVLGGDAGDYVRSRLRAQGVRQLDIHFDHVLAVEHLPEHHRDPFDRLLVAQARVEGLMLISVDHRLRAYDVPFYDAEL
jgi:PIN domain nuclease of toxin-antitoxin system